MALKVVFYLANILLFVGATLNGDDEDFLSSGSGCEPSTAADEPTTQSPDSPLTDTATSIPTNPATEEAPRSGKRELVRFVSISVAISVMSLVIVITVTVCLVKIVRRKRERKAKLAALNQHSMEQGHATVIPNPMGENQGVGYLNPTAEQNDYTECK